MITYAELTTKPNQYVLGFMFAKGEQEVLLIRKAKPAWQYGKLNGVGGKIEPGEPALSAMVREFAEETRVVTTESDWRLFARMAGRDWAIHCYTARADAGVLRDAVAYPVFSAEPIILMPTAGLTAPDLIPNLRYLIPLAMADDLGHPAMISYAA